VWDKSVVQAVDKAIRASNLGLNPIMDGQTLRIPIPPLTGERRTELAKVAGKYAEQQRVAVRNVRRDAMEHLKKLEKDHVISQDEHKRHNDEVQKITDEHIRKIDEMSRHKEEEIMQV
jgi:ribosome recycling factor